MKLILLASMLALAAAAPKADPQGVTAKPELVVQPFIQPQAVQGQYYNPLQQHRGAYDQYYRGYRPHEQNTYFRGQYDPKYYSGQYDGRYYAGQYDPKYSAGQYDPKYYGGQYDPKYYGGQYDPKYYGGQYDPKYYKTQYQYDPKHYQQYKGEHVPIVEQSSEVNHDGSFRYSYATADGQQAQAEGIVKKSDIDPQDDANSVRGSYSYTAPDGTPVAYSYVADEHGFRVEGTHVPKTPEAIQRSLEYNAQYEKNPTDYQQYYKQYQYNQYARPTPVAVK